MKKWIAIIALLSPALLQAGVVFTYNNVNISTGTLTLFRLDTAGGFELIQGESKNDATVAVTNHVCGDGVDVQPFLADLKQLSQDRWLIDGKPPQKDPRRVEAGDMLTVILGTYNDNFVELRPLTGYTNVVGRFDQLIQKLAKRNKCNQGAGILYTTRYVGTFNEQPAVLTDPYAVIGLPWLNHVFTSDEYDAMRKGGEMQKLTYSLKDRVVAITEMMKMVSTNGQTTLQDIH
jgi:hypothetical protein